MKVLNLHFLINNFSNFPLPLTSELTFNLVTLKFGTKFDSSLLAQIKSFNLTLLPGFFKKPI